ncbi:DUF2339 domain-containing protein [Chitinimonas sp.]|uniref:DUF2339 domain-containing protein n=1 Tax=Chitinimonas sp. TaxID=1934313 RepID=UPI002F9493CD
MAWLGLIVGLLLGALLGQEQGWWVGAALGWLWGRDRVQAAELRTLKAALQKAAATPVVQAQPTSEPAEAAAEISPAEAATPLPITQEPAPEPIPSLPLAAAPTAAPTTPPPLPATEPTLALTVWSSWATQWLLQGNPAVKVGVLLLIMGAAFLLKYAAAYVSFPLEARYLGLLLGAGGAIAFGWRQRERRPAFAHSLQGGGLGIAFLTVFAAFRLHGLVPAGAAFALLAGLATFSAALALAQSAQALAVIGLAGGFLAPILASTGQGSHVLLFSYYAVLNLGVAYVAQARAWRGLNLLGFLFTFVIGTAWGVLRYRAEQFSSTEPFLIGFWLLYLGLAIAFTRHRQAEAGLGRLARDPVDATLVFGVPLVGFGLQSLLVQQHAYGAAWSAGGMALVYGILWQTLRRRLQYALLATAFCILMTGFATLTIPLALGAHWTAASWALEGAGLVWLGTRQRRRLSRWSGYLLILLAGGIALVQLDELGRSSSWLNGTLLAIVLAALSAWLAGAVRGQVQGRLQLPLLLWGLLLWLAGGLAGIDHYTALPRQIAAMVLLLASTAVLLTALAQRLRWPMARLPALALPVGLGLLLLYAADQQQTPLQDGGWLVWLLAALACYGCLRWDETALPRLGRQWAHRTGFWLWTAWLTWVAADASSRLGSGSAWIWLGALAVPGLVLCLCSSAPARRHWPLKRYRRDYLRQGPALVAGLLLPILLVAPWASNGSAAPWGWLPLLNPLDLGWMLALLGLANWLRQPYRGRRRLLGQAALPALLALIVFGWLNALLAHGFHHWAGLPYVADQLWREQSFQAALSLLWTTVALLTMLLAHRGGWRRPWLAGAALIALTVLKLFLIDLDGAGGLARIVSFLGVGLLLVAVGWFAPAPPDGKAPSEPG